MRNNKTKTLSEMLQFADHRDEFLDNGDAYNTDDFKQFEACGFDSPGATPETIKNNYTRLLMTRVVDAQIHGQSLQALFDNERQQHEQTKRQLVELSDRYRNYYCD